MNATFVLDGSLAQERTGAARAGAWAQLTLLTFGLGVHVVRAWKGRYTRPYGRTLAALWVASALHAASLYETTATRYSGTDTHIVASWACGILADSHWFASSIHAPARTRTASYTSLGLCAMTTLMVLFCEPIRVVHHVLDATLTLCAFLVYASTRTEDDTIRYVRAAAFARFASALGWMAWDMPQYVARDVAPVHAYWTATTAVFVLAVLRSYRFRFKNAYEVREEAVPTFRAV